MRLVLLALAAVAAFALVAGACRSFSPAAGSTAGEKVYNSSNCIICHGKNGGGAQGPSLLDRPLTHQGIEDQVRRGKPGEMPAYETILTPDQIRLVADWVAELRSRAGVTTPAR